MPVQDDDPYEDEEEEDQESDELVVVEDKPYISHKQAQSVRLLGILENIERRVCFAPRAPAFDFAAWGALAQASLLGPGLALFCPQDLEARMARQSVPKLCGQRHIILLVPQQWHCVRCRHATSYSGFEEKSTPGMTRITSPVKTSMGLGLGHKHLQTSVAQTFSWHSHDPGKSAKIICQCLPSLMASHSFWKSGHILLQHASAPHSNLCISDRSTTQATFIKDVLQSTAMTFKLIQNETAWQVKGYLAANRMTF